MVVDEVVVVAGTAEVVVVEDVVLGDSEVPDSSDGTEEVEVVDAEVELVLPVALVLIVVLGVAAVTPGSYASSAPSTDGEPCSSATLSVAAVVVAASGCMVVAVPATVAVVGAELLVLLFDEQLDASKIAASAIAM